MSLWRRRSLTNKIFRQDPSPWPDEAEHYADPANRVPVGPPIRRRKTNRARWCKGRVGVEHEWGFWLPGYGPQHKSINLQSWRMTGPWAGRIDCYRVCERCGKIDHHFGKFS